jgi:demethylmenaquinone methyltransferase/2-methoxy-6-polyprenyl-1,4-benzoquinol methylase
VYYDKRAPEYDDWWLGRGLFARRNRPGWQREVRRLEAVVANLPAASTLDVACGTGFLSKRLRGDLTLVDQSQAMLALARERVPHADVIRAEVPPLPFGDGSFGRVFTSHFYGHLRDEQRAEFVDEARRVAEELVVVDAGGGDREQVQDRVLNDGSRHEVYKRWFSAATLADELGGGEILLDGDWFVVVRV